MMLPKNGSVVVIDNEPKEAMPIIQVLARKGIPVTYYKGNDKTSLPKDKFQNVRLIFLDLQLIDTSDEHHISKHIANLLDKVISPTNGPFILVVWSKNRSKYESMVLDEIKKHEHLFPSCVIGFNKRDCLEEKIIPSIDKKNVIEKVLDKIKGSIDTEEIPALKKVLNDVLSEEYNTEFVARENALETIEKHIEEGLKDAGIFHLFVIWENLVNKASSSTVQAISDTIETNDLWEGNLRDVIKRMAKARTGQNDISDDLALKAALGTFSYSFSEELESSIRDYVFPDYVKLDSPFIISGYDSGDVKFEISRYQGADGKPKLKLAKNGTSIKDNLSVKNFHKLANGINQPDKSIVEGLINTYINIPNLINTKLHLELNPSNELMPGNVYKIDVSDEKKIKYLPTYFDRIDNDLNKYQFIEIEVSPICDYAQKKWKKSRLLSGVLYSGELTAKSKIDHLYPVRPRVIIDEKPYNMIFDFHLFKSKETDEVEAEREIWFRLKRELLLDIIANLSSHVNRPGISYME
ncbi:hypothetical protein [Galbibacter sp. PAP.153]|uniref:hypothetical protein n=1 Tax=Galbibacter sp. PAP.153 TaxID=3104623 RepID=UPI00300AC88F